MKILFAGNRQAGYECLKAIDKKDLLGVLTKDEKIKKYCKKYKIECFENKDQKALIEMAPDIIFSVYYHKILIPELLNASKTNINFHGGDLPKYGGSYSSIWAIIDNLKETAVTAHYMADELDSGDIIKHKSVTISDDETGETLFNKMSSATVELFKEIYKQLTNGEVLEGKSQNGETFLYSRELPNKGEIDWNKSPEEIDRFVRALYFPPFEPAHIIWADKKFYVYKVRVGKKGVYIEDGRYEMIK